jgi:glycosyltransferase involved in cell wall biosynthesis
LANVSILIPCRDAAAHLPAAIASIHAQTFRDFEVIAIDDGSTDETGALLDGWAARDPRVRVLHAPPRGIVVALQHAAGLARGELLARMDADDVAAADRLARQVALLAGDPSLAACGTQVRYFPRAEVRAGARRYEQWLNALTTPEQIERDLFVECPLAHPALLVRRAAFERAGGYQERGWPEDYDLVLRLWASGGRLANVPAVLLDWRERAGRLSRTDARYAQAHFQACKAHHLARTLAQGRPVVVWGAGPVGKGFARALAGEGVRIAAFVELHPRKIGQIIHGAPVIAAADVGRHPDAFFVAAVAGPVARAEIRAALAATGRRELRDYCAVA